MTHSTHKAADKAADSQTPSPVPGQAHIDALRTSVEHRHKLAAPLTGQQLTGPAYPTQWTVAQVLSHLGSAAVIMQRQLDDALAGHDTPDERDRFSFAPGPMKFGYA